MEIRILGPLEVIHENRPVRLAGPRTQIALAMLALESNRIVSVDRLVAALWNNSPPSTARGQIQICVSALRRTFTEYGQADLIVTRPPGYLLKVDDEMIDARLFDRHLDTASRASATGQLDDAAAAIRAALQLWRGPVLNGLESEILYAARQRFEERQLTAIEELCDIELAAGRHAELIPTLRDLVSENPLREHLHAQLMIALHRSSRQAEALEAYRAARSVLTEELGIEPGEELRRLERGILTGEVSAEAPIRVRAVEPRREPAPAVPRLLPADIADFTGREDSLDEIAGMLTADEDRSAVPIVVLSGTGGVGKSALAVRVAQRVAERFPDGQLYANLQGATANPVASGQLLVNFLRVLGVSPNAIPDDLEGRGDLFRSHLATRRVLIVLDDAGAESQVLPILPGNARCAVLITSRIRLVGLPGAHHVDTTVLPSERAVELLSRIAGPTRIDAEPAVAAELAHLCGFLPLALRIMGAKLASRPHWRVSELAARMHDETRRLDELVHGDLGVRASIALSYEGLDPSARRLLRRLALLDAPHVASWAAAALLDCAVEPAQDLLEVLGEAQLVEPFRDPTTGEVRYRFHELIRLFGRERLIAEESPEERVEALRRTLSAWLTLAEEAHRAEYGGDYVVLHSAEPRWATFSSPVFALIRAHPIAWLDSERAGLVAAVRQAAAAGFDEICWDLAMTSVTLFEAKTYYDDWREVNDIALAATEAAGNRRGWAAMLASAGERYIFQQRWDDALAALVPALETFQAVQDRHGQALVGRNLTFVDRVRGDAAGAYARYAALVDEFDAVDDQIGKAHVLNGMARLKLDAGDPGAAEALLADALAIALRVGSRRVEAQVRHTLGEAYLSRGSLESSAESFHWVLRIVRHNGDEIGETYALHGLGMVRHREGRYADAEASLTSALRIARRIEEPLVEARVLHALGEMEVSRSRFEAAKGYLADASVIYRRLRMDSIVTRIEQTLQSMRATASMGQ
jgi:DNA-binding SARP family transcriptional activator